MKSQFNMTRGVVRVTGNDQMGLDRVFDVSGIRKGVFLVRFYNTDTEGTLYLESSNQNTDATDALWEVVGEPGGFDLKAIQDLTPPLQQIGSITADLGRYFRWRIAFDAATPPISASVIFEITVLGRG